MTKNDYLDIAGYDPKIWDIMSKESSDRYLKEKGAQNNMFSITDRKAVTAFGKGSYVVKIQWMNNTIDIMDAEGRSGADKQAPPAPESKVPAPPAPPSETKTTVPLPPAPTTEVEETIKEVVEEQEWLCDRYDQTGIVCEQQCKFCKDAEDNNITVKEQKVIAETKLKEIVKESGVPTDNVIIATVPKIEETVNDKTEEQKEFVKDLHGGDFKEEQVNKAIESSEDIQELADKVTEIVEEVEITEEMKTPIIADKKAITITDGIESKGIEIIDVSKIESIPKEIEKRKTNKKEEKPKVNELKDVKLPIASDKAVKQFAVVDEVLKTLTVFKWTFYAVESIKEIIENKDTPAKKLTAIKKLLDNV